MSHMLAVFLDTETSGLNPLKHKIVELAYLIVDIVTGERKLAFQATLHLCREDWGLSDAESLRIHQLTWEEVSLGRKKEEVREEIIAHFTTWDISRGKAVFICQNPSFDRSFFSQIIDPDIQESLHWPYHWLDLASMYWVKAIQMGKQQKQCFPWVKGVSKDQIAFALNLPPESKPHRAMNGVEHLLACYRAVVGFPMEPVTSYPVC